MGSMSASDAAPLPRLGEVFFDVRGSSRSMRLSWYSDTGVAVFSIWQGGTCTGTFRLPIDDLPRMVEALQRGPRGAALPADSCDLAGAPPHRALTGAATGPMPALASFPDYGTGQDVPMTGEFRAMAADDGPPGIPNAAGGAVSRSAGSYSPAPYGGDPPGSGGYPVYRDRAPGPLAAPSGPPPYADRTVGAGSSFPGYADDGPPPSYRGAEPGTPPPSFQDDPLNAPYPGDPLGSGSYRQQQPRPGYGDPEPSYGGDPPGSGGYPVYRDRAPGPLAAPSGPPPYADRTVGAGSSFPGYADDGPPPSYRGAEPGTPPPSFQDDPLNAPYPGDPLGSGSYRQQQPRPGYGDPEPSYGGDPPGSGGYPVYRDRAPGPLAAPSGPPPYADRTVGAPSPYRDDAPGGFFRGEPAGGSLHPGEDRGPRYPDDPFQSMYPDDARSGSHPYGVPDRPEQRAPRGRP
jgi:hypothetical protein